MAKPVSGEQQVGLVHRVGVLGADETGKGRAAITAVYKMSEAEYEEYKTAVTELNAWARSDAHLLIGYSYRSLQQTMRRCAALYAQTPKPSNPRNVKLAINADFLGLLSHARLYLDHVETQLKRATHTEKDAELAEFKRITAHEYDNVFAYRFCYRLRNYAIHCGFPITGFNAHSGFVNGTTETKHSFAATFDTKLLLANFSEWGAQVKAELEAMTEQPDIMKIAADYVAALDRVQRQLLQTYLPRLERYAKVLSATAKHAEGTSGNPHIISLPPDDEITPPVTSLNITLERIPLELVSFVEDIRKSNAPK